MEIQGLEFTGTGLVKDNQSGVTDKLSLNADLDLA